MVARYKRMRGFNVLHPIGWDALGLPAENAAIKRGVHPEKWTRDNIAGMKRQLQRLGFSYPWSREIATCDPEYYRWNQWFFLRMLERGIAYRAKAAVNWCPSCQTVLANEQARGRRRAGAATAWSSSASSSSGSCASPPTRTQLLDDMAQLPDVARARAACSSATGSAARTAPRSTSRSRAATPIRVFTTRIDTIYGATFMVLAPEHPRVDGARRGQPDEAAREARSRGSARRTAARARRAGREGRRLHRPLRHEPVHGERIPIWVGNFVLMGYGTGAIMAVPAHDQRDFEFARKYGLPVRVVIQPDGRPTLDGDDARRRLRRPGHAS